MTNYEKYKEEIINMLVRENTCMKITQLRYGTLKCKKQTCTECINEQKQWLEAEAKEFDPAELKAGDKIIMRKNGDCYTYECEVLGNSLSTLWLRLRSEKQQEDSGFLISHKDMLEHFVIEEVFI